MSSRLCWSSREFADLIAVHPNTLNRWDKSGVLAADRWPSGRRYYTPEHLYRAMGRAIPKPFPAELSAFVFCQVGVAMKEREIDARLALDTVESLWSNRSSVST